MKGLYLVVWRKEANLTCVEVEATSHGQAYDAFKMKNLGGGTPVSANYKMATERTMEVSNAAGRVLVLVTLLKPAEPVEAKPPVVHNNPEKA